MLSDKLSARCRRGGEVGGYSVKSSGRKVVVIRVHVVLFIYTCALDVAFLILFCSLYPSPLSVTSPIAPPSTLRLHSPFNPPLHLHHPILPLDHPIQTPLLHHQTHNLIQHIRRRHGRMFGVSIVGGGHLDDIGRDEIDALEAAHDGSQFARGPAAGFGGAGCRGDWWFVSSAK